MKEGLTLMEFYVGWSHSDAKFPEYFNKCSMLVSAVPDNRRALRSFSNFPGKLIVDSGSVFYVRQEPRPTALQIFELQLELIADLPPSVKIELVHFDEPMLHKTKTSEYYYAIEKTLFNAWEFMSLFTKQRLPESIKPMAVIQGFDAASIAYSALKLLKMGYQSFGIGSLLQRSPGEQMSMIQSAARIVGPELLHVFGVTGMPQMKQMSKLGIRSIDSTRPTLASVYFQVFYSNPFRTYIIAESRVNKAGPRITSPLNCDCPVCSTDPTVILVPSPRKFVKLRALHNYHHLKAQLDTITSVREV